MDNTVNVPLESREKLKAVIRELFNNYMENTDLKTATVTDNASSFSFLGSDGKEYTMSFKRGE